MRTKLKIGIVGLGLIGGSLAKAFKKYTTYEVSGYDINPEIITKSILCGDLDKEMNIEECDLIISALYPKATVDFVKANAEKIKNGAVVMDCGGTKKLVCDELKDVGNSYGFRFIGAHPMAGTEHSGYEFAKADMFSGASLIICSSEEKELEEIFSQIGFVTFKYTTAEVHDSVIAFTSQLAHVVSNAFVKSKAFPNHKGFSAGSLKDLTRVAWLNETMWTELFLENADNLTAEIDSLIDNLKEYSKAVKDRDATKLKELLKDGRIIKETVDGR